MAVSEGSPAPAPQMVGNAFVEQYYSILHQSPDQVHRFYHDSSSVTRPEADGTVTSVTTIDEINKKILSQDYTSVRVEILSADAQLSYYNGVLVTVTGCLTESDNTKRKFTQTFFLAPQDKGFYVLNDIFRYVDEYKSADIESVPVNDADETEPPSEAFTPEPEPVQVADEIPPSQTVIADIDISDSKEVSQPLENGKLSVAEKVIPVNPVKESSHQEQQPSTEKAASNVQEDAPKKSFASIVNALKGNSAPFHVRTSPAKPLEQAPRVPSVPAPEALAVAASTDSSPSEKNNDNTGKAYAIFVANLPMNATVDQLDRVFKKFGPIKPNGIQVRSNKGSCFGFVEFESAASMQSALEASPPVMLDNRRLSIEERRANNDRANDCELSLAVVRDVLCQCGFDVEKALDVLLDLSANERSSNDKHPDYRADNMGDVRYLVDYDHNDSFIDRRSESTSLSSEGEISDNFWSMGSFGRNYAEVLTNSKANSHISPGCTKLELPQKVLESLFKIPKSSEHDKGTMNWRSVAKKMQSLGPGFDACQNVAESQPHSYTKGGEYQVFREDAKQHWDSVKSYFQKAATAYTKGERSYASYLSDQGKEQTKLAQKADTKASHEIFVARNKGIENVITIDLHGQHVKAAMRMLKLHLLFGSYVPSVQMIRVITGCGSHGFGKSKLKQSVTKLLDKEKVEWREENRGTVLIKLNGWREFNFLDDDDNSDSD